MVSKSANEMLGAVCLATCYRVNGVEYGAYEAAKWFRRAAEQSSAQNYIGSML